MAGLRLESSTRRRWALWGALLLWGIGGVADAQGPPAGPPGYGPPSYAPQPSGPAFPVSTPGGQFPYATGPGAIPPGAPLPVPPVPGAMTEIARPSAALPSPEILTAPPRIAPGQTLVVSVQVLGYHAKPVSTLPALKTKAGEPFDPQAVEDDVKKLIKSRRFVDVEPKITQVANGVSVTFQVVERPTIMYIKVVGNKTVLSYQLINKTGLKVGDGLDPYSIKEARDKLETYYHEHGCAHAKVTVAEGINPGDRGVVFLIDEGPEQRVWKTKFIGNTIATSARLRTVIKIGPPILYLINGWVDMKVIDEDVERLTAYYRSLGFFQCKIGRECEFNDSDKWLTVTFVINEGPRFMIRNITFVGPQKVTADKWNDKLKLHANEFFNQAYMTRDLTAIRDTYGSRGYVFADVQADPRFLEQTGMLDLVYNIKEGSRYRVGTININISGDDTHTSSRVAYNRLSIRPGDILDTTKVRNDERRMGASSVFENKPGKGPKIVFHPPPGLEDGGKGLADKPAGRPSMFNSNPAGSNNPAGTSGTGYSSSPSGSNSMSSNPGPNYRGQAPDDDAEDQYIDVSVSGTLNAPSNWSTAAALDRDLCRPLPPVAEPTGEADLPSDVENAASPQVAPALPYEPIIRGQAPEAKADKDATLDGIDASGRKIMDRFGIKSYDQREESGFGWRERSQSTFFFVQDFWYPCHQYGAAVETPTTLTTAKRQSNEQSTTIIPRPDLGPQRVYNPQRLPLETFNTPSGKIVTVHDRNGSNVLSVGKIEFGEPPPAHSGWRFNAEGEEPDEESEWQLILARWPSNWQRILGDSSCDELMHDLQAKSLLEPIPTAEPTEDKSPDGYYDVSFEYSSPAIQNPFAALEPMPIPAPTFTRAKPPFRRSEAWAAGSQPIIRGQAPDSPNYSGLVYRGQAPVGGSPVQGTGPDSAPFLPVYNAYYQSGTQVPASTVNPAQYAQPAPPAYNSGQYPTGPGVLPPPGYPNQQPPPGYVAPQPGYVAPQPGYQPQPPGYGPQPTFPLPGPSYPSPPVINPNPAPNGQLQNFFEDPRLGVDVNAAETQTGKLSLGVGVNSDAGLVGNIVVDEQNFDISRWPSSWEDIREGEAWRGAGQRLRIDVSPGVQVQNYSASFQEPYLADTPVSFTERANYFQRIYDFWNESRTGNRIGVGYYFTPDLSGSIGARVEEVRVYNPTIPTPPELEQVLGHNFVYGAYEALSHDTRDSPFLPGSGHLLQLNLEQNWGDWHYPVETFDARQYWTLSERADGSGKSTIGAGLKVGFSGPDTPLYDHFYAGGYSTLRGFYFRGASPLQDNVQVGGDFEFLGTVEYIFPLTADDVLKGTFFVDYGTVEPDAELKWQDFRIAPGFGLRIAIPQFGSAPIALDFAFPVHKMPGDKLQFFSFWVGINR